MMMNDRKRHVWLKCIWVKELVCETYQSRIRGVSSTLGPYEIEGIQGGVVCWAYPATWPTPASHHWRCKHTLMSTGLHPLVSLCVRVGCPCVYGGGGCSYTHSVKPLWPLPLNTSHSLFQMFPRCYPLEMSSVRMKSSRGPALKEWCWYRKTAWDEREIMVRISHIISKDFYINSKIFWQYFCLGNTSSL